MKHIITLLLLTLAVVCNGTNKTIVIENNGLMVTKDKFYALMLGNVTEPGICIQWDEYRNHGKEDYLLSEKDWETTSAWLQKNALEDTITFKSYYGSIKISFWVDCKLTGRIIIGDKNNSIDLLDRFSLFMNTTFSSRNKNLELAIDRHIHKIYCPDEDAAGIIESTDFPKASILSKGHYSNDSIYSSIADSVISKWFSPAIISTHIRKNGIILWDNFLLWQIEFDTGILGLKDTCTIIYDQYSQKTETWNFPKEYMSSFNAIDPYKINPGASNSLLKIQFRLVGMKQGVIWKYTYLTKEGGEGKSRIRCLYR